MWGVCQNFHVGCLILTCPYGKSKCTQCTFFTNLGLQIYKYSIEVCYMHRRCSNNIYIFMIKVIHSNPIIKIYFISIEDNFAIS